MEPLHPLAILLILYGSAFAKQQSLQYYYTQAKEAYKVGDHPKFYELIIKAKELHPYHQGILYHPRLAAALTNHPDEAIHFLQEAIQVNTTFDLDLEILKSLSGTTAFEKLKLLQKELQQPIIHSDTAFLIKDRTLHPESITSEKEGRLYLSSVHQRKIIKSDTEGNITDFTKPAQDGMTSVRNKSGQE